MRFSVELMLKEEYISKDKNRIIISLLKNCFNSYHAQYYQDQYEGIPNKVKEFTFSLYMAGCKFLRDEIHIPSKKIILNFSAYTYEDGIIFHNSILTHKGHKYPIKGNEITIGKIRLIEEKPIYNNEATFITKSPIVIREHKGDNKNTWYHSIGTEQGQVIMLENLKHQLKGVFGDEAENDLKDLQINVIGEAKQVKVKNYGIEVLANIVKINIKAKPYIIDYFYKAGIGSKRGSGFGMLEMV